MAAAPASCERTGSFAGDVAAAFDKIAEHLPRHYLSDEAVPRFIYRRDPAADLQCCTWSGIVNPTKSESICTILFWLKDYKMKTVEMRQVLSDAWEKVFDGHPEYRERFKGTYWHKFFVTELEEVDPAHFVGMEVPPNLCFQIRPATAEELAARDGGGNSAARPTRGAMVVDCTQIPLGNR